MGSGSEGGLIFFDITMLALRAGYKTPTGVGRVELAYAMELLDRYPHRVRFVVALRRMVQLVPNSIVRRYLRTIDLAWRDQHTRRNEETITRLCRFLDVPAAFFGPRTQTTSSRGDMLLLSANMWMTAALKGLAPRRLTKFRFSNEQHVYVYVSGSNLPSQWIERWLARSPAVKGVFLLHDVIPLTHPEYVRARVPARHARYVRRVLTAADVVVANSAFTAETVVDFARDCDLSLPDTVIAPLGTSAIFARRPPPAYETPPYFVYVSTIEPRKNHLMLLQVWSRLVERHGERAPKLILIGRRGWENENIVDILERARTSGQHVLECSQLCDEALAAVLQHARAMLMPSHVEGYGLPVAESLSLGTPVICSDLAPFKEIAGDVPEYVDPLAGRGWAKLIMQYANTDSPERMAQLERIKSYRPPTWEKHFEKITRIIDGYVPKHNALERSFEYEPAQ